jgi:hypothetical protein
MTWPLCCVHSTAECVVHDFKNGPRAQACLLRFEQRWIGAMQETAVMQHVQDDDAHDENHASMIWARTRLSR